MNPRAKRILIKYRREVDMDIVVEVREKIEEDRKISEDEDIWNRRLERIRKKFSKE